MRLINDITFRKMHNSKNVPAEHFDEILCLSALPWNARFLRLAHLVSRRLPSICVLLLAVVPLCVQIHLKWTKQQICDSRSSSKKKNTLKSQPKIKSSEKQACSFFLCCECVCVCAYVFAFIFLILFSEFLIRYTNVNENKPYAHSKHLHSYYLDIQI